MTSVEHRLLIRHPTDPAVLVETDRAGGVLPSLALETGHTAEVVRRHPWMRDLVPYTVRMALEHLDPRGGSKP